MKTRYAVTMADHHSWETFTSKRAAMAFARKVKDDHKGASVHEYGPNGLGDCLASWTLGEDRKVRRVFCVGVKVGPGWGKL